MNANAIQNNPAARDTAEAAAERHPFLAALGQRVRQQRERLGLTRKAMARSAEVSERHLANLEYGVGNVSVLVLVQVARALHCPLAELLGDSAGAPAGSAASRRIALIGLRGAGKSTLGRLLAEDLDFPFVELSRRIEALAGCSTAEIQALYGQGAYRRYERRALDETLAEHAEVVIATPGGLVSDTATFNRVLGNCTTVWLRADPEHHMQRVVAQGDMRPMAASREAMADLKRILDGRSAFYSRCALSIDTSAQDEEASFGLLRSQVRQVLQMPA